MTCRRSTATCAAGAGVDEPCGECDQVHTGQGEIVISGERVDDNVRLTVAVRASASRRTSRRRCSTASTRWTAASAAHTAGAGLGLSICRHRRAAQRAHLGRKRGRAGPRQSLPCRAAHPAPDGRSADHRLHHSGREEAMAEPLGTLQVDVDDLWVYYESIGRTTPPAAPCNVHAGHPRLLDLFDRYGARATFFVCGRDLPTNSVLAEMVRRGHEVANHSAACLRNGYARLSRAELAPCAGRARTHCRGDEPAASGGSRRPASALNAPA